MTTRKGIILAGGLASRLYPLSIATSKQLMHVYDKPMIYYPLCTLLLANIRDILIITTPSDVQNFKRLLKDGSQFGINISYETQDDPKGGIAQAFIIGEKFIESSNPVLILGDNIFYGSDLADKLENANQNITNSTIFAYHVNDPMRYGVIEFNKDNKALSIEEKPLKPKSNYAVTGLYFYDNSVINIAKSIKPSKRGELEISDININYLNQGRLTVEKLDRGYAWFDTGTFESLNEAGNYIASIQKRQGRKICCPEEIAISKNWISLNDYLSNLNLKGTNSYIEYLKKTFE